VLQPVAANIVGALYHKL